MVRVPYLLVIVTGVALGLFLLERLFPLRMATQALTGRLATNVCISGLVFDVVAVTIRPVCTEIWSASCRYTLKSMPSSAIVKRPR